ncbi:MAG: hypothetical protein R2941_13160, partial [Desulfobacterales bacterium]
MKHFFFAKYNILFFSVILLSLYLHWDSSIYPLEGNHDSIRYLEMAETMLKGEWLGSYNHMTLIRLPVYSMLLALNSMAGWRLHIMQHILHILSIILLSYALKSAKTEDWRNTFVCILCILHPVLVMPVNYVATEAVYTSFATVVLSGFIGCWGEKNGSLFCMLFWLITLSISLALLWHIRAESVWILPSCILLFTLSLFCPGVGFSARCKKLLFLFIPFLFVFVVKDGLERMNQKYYGISVAHEIAEANFVNAFKGLSRLDGERHHPHVPVTFAAMNEAYQISPNFFRLKSFLSEQKDGKGWSQFGCEWMGICDELAGGWIMWAVRDAAASAG